MLGQRHGLLAAGSSRSHLATLGLPVHLRISGVYGIHHCIINFEPSLCIKSREQHASDLHSRVMVRESTYSQSASHVLSGLVDVCAGLRVQERAADCRFQA